MKRLFIAGLLGSIAFASHSASAQEAPRYKFIGMQFDIATPSGVALGIEGRLPYVPWFKLGIAGTYLLSPGVRGNLLIDPIRFPVVPVIDLDVGYQSPFTVPGVNNSPSGSFVYEDVRGGLAFGSRSGARFLLLAGMTHLSGSVSNLQSSITASPGVSFGNPHFDGFVPSVKLGFEVLF
jgi:hypothetical protein